MMEHRTITSSLISKVGYDHETQEMEVHFIRGGVYQYTSVSPDDHAEFISASSIGRHYNDHVRGNFNEGRLR